MDQAPQSVLEESASLSSIAVVPWPSKISRLRFLAAVLGIPLFDALLGYVAAPVVWWLGNHGAYRPVRPDEVPLRLGLLTGTLGFLVMFTAGIPVAVWLMRRRWTAIHHFAVAGILLGNFPFAGYVCMRTCRLCSISRRSGSSGRGRRSSTARASRARRRSPGFGPAFRCEGRGAGTGADRREMFGRLTAARQSDDQAPAFL